MFLGAVAYFVIVGRTRPGREDPAGVDPAAHVVEGAPADGTPAPVRVERLPLSVHRCAPSGVLGPCFRADRATSGRCGSGRAGGPGRRCSRWPEWSP
ncbi:hypothetical protein BU198_39095 [Streptomyces sp. CBMA156]|nr:hypothetical protein [Streptomyces sp. CBMA156]